MQNKAKWLTNMIVQIPLWLGAGFLLVLIPFGFFFLVMMWTGEILRYLVTFGCHKPTYNLDSVKTIKGLYLLGEVSMYLGITFWLSVLVLVRYLLRT
jgi:hypothetical protein